MPDALAPDLLASDPLGSKATPGPARPRDARVAALTAPLPAGHPAPAEFRYDPEFEALEQQIRRLERDGPGAVSWPELVRGAEAILASRSRDLSVAAWFALAVAQAEGLAGLATGLAVLRDLVEDGWDELFPPAARARQRSGVMEWLVPRLARAVPDGTVPPAAEAAAIAAAADAAALDQLLAERLPSAPPLRDLLRPLQALAEAARQAAGARDAAARAAAPSPSMALPQPTNQPSPVAPASSGALSAAPTPVAPSANGAPMPPAAPLEIAVAPDGNAERTLGAVREAVRKAALALLEADPAEWRAHALLGGVTWLQITEAPPAQGGRTALLPPPATRLAEFAALEKAGNWPDLVTALASFCSGSGLFWLDGQRRSAEALSRLGPAFAACARAVVAGTAALLSRLPTLAALSFEDGTPFADPATRVWLEATMPAAVGVAGSEAGDDAQPWLAALAEARRAVAAGAPDAAFDALAGAARTATDGQGRFRWRLAVARFALEAELVPLALALLRELAAVAERHDLAAWDPALAAECSLLLHRCLALPGSRDAFAEDAHGRAVAAAFARLAWADPAAAARLVRSGGAGGTA